MVVLAVVLTAILALQYYWVSKTIELQRNETVITLRDDVSGIVDYLENHYYCFQLYGEVDIPPGSSYYTITPNLNQGIDDTLDIFHYRNEKPDSNYRFSKLDFSVPAKVRIAFNFEYTEPSPEIPVDSLSEKEQTILELYQRYLRIDDLPTVDTVDLREELAKLNEKQIENIGVGVELYMPGTEDVIYAHQPKGFDDCKPFTTIQHTLNENSAFLKKVPFRFFIYDNRPFYQKINIWLVAVSLLLFGVMLLILFLFIRSIGQQRKTVELRNELLANITHEFNTPVTNISLALKSLKISDERSERAKRIITEENERIKNNIDIILSAASLKNGIPAVEHHATSVHSCLKMVSDVAQVQLDEFGGNLMLRLEARNDTVMGDEVHLLNVFHNLVDNAIKYCEKEPDITISTTNEGKSVVVTVSDNGVGIAKEHQKLIFEKFYRVSNQYRHEHKGFGFGLHYVQLVVEAHKGSIVLQSEPGKGTDFIIKLPVKS